MVSGGRFINGVGLLEIKTDTLVQQLLAGQPRASTRLAVLFDWFGSPFKSHFLAIPRFRFVLDREQILLREIPRWRLAV